MPTNPKLILRPALRSDVPAMAALVARFVEYMRELGDTTDLKLDAESLERDGFGPNPAFRGVLAVVDGEVVGYLLHHDGYDTDAACRLLFVIDLFVAPEARARGIGRALMGAARDIAQIRDARQVVWTVDRRNLPARRFYERIGARPVEDLDLMCLDAT